MSHLDQIEKLLKSDNEENIQLALATIETKLTKDNSIAFYYILKKYALEAEVIDEFIKKEFNLSELSNSTLYKQIVQEKLIVETAELFLKNELEIFKAVFKHAGYDLPSFTEQS